ncbi:hypothetical protein K0M31_015132 [Melipona bicolor]|uniref:Uncharacterized protein n=1 Tax=Melipona bicolor TaxID=60889 RepID=A0AA40KFN5_9HYME|nr:hypothetical protein K0M31_015132 [Melipona bicolor]
MSRPGNKVQTATVNSLCRMQRQTEGGTRRGIEDEVRKRTERRNEEEEPGQRRLKTEQKAESCGGISAKLVVGQPVVGRSPDPRDLISTEASHTEGSHTGLCQLVRLRA